MPFVVASLRIGSISSGGLAVFDPNAASGRTTVLTPAGNAESRST